MSSDRTWTWGRVILGVLQTFVGLGSAGAGLALVTDPSGATLGATPSLLAGSPLSSFTTPGLFLLVIVGFGHFGAAAATFTRRRYAGLIAVLFGLILCGAIATVGLVLDETPPLLNSFIALGMLELLQGMILRLNDVQAGSLPGRRSRRASKAPQDQKD